MQNEFDVGSSQPADDLMSSLRGLVNEAATCEIAIAQLEADLKATRSTLHALRSSRIPDLMAMAGLERARFDGWDVSVGQYVSGSLPKDFEARQGAFDWLESVHAGGLIKNEISVEFPRSQDAAAKKLFSQLNDEGYSVELEASVHPQTLLAFARARLANGEDVDLDALGLKAGRIAKLARSEK